MKWLARLLALDLLLTLFSPAKAAAQSKLSPRWEELTAGDFRAAILQSQGVCLLPFGILEKHGPHLPIGTDLINVCYAFPQAVQQEYALVFPEYYFGQIFEAKHEPGAVAYSRELPLQAVPAYSPGEITCFSRSFARLSVL